MPAILKIKEGINYPGMMLIQIKKDVYYILERWIVNRLPSNYLNLIYGVL
jgi:hypothetical protein